MGMVRQAPPPREPNNLHLITVAIDRTGLPFIGELNACKDDARRIAWKIEKDVPIRGALHAYLHDDEEATLDRITQSFEKVVAQARPDDVLVIFLAGYAVLKEGFRLLTHPGDQTWADVSEASEHALSLEKLHSWTSQIECQKQLFILDLCSEEGMQDVLISALSSQDPQLTALTRRNRVIISSEGVAYETAEGGVLTQILTGIDASLLDLFDPHQRKRVEFEILQRQQDFPVLQNPWFYSRIFYEKDYADLAARIRAVDTRGTTIPDQTQTPTANVGPEDCALVVAIDEFDAPGWDSLRNPIADGTRVEELLRKEYGYDTRFLPNATYDDLQGALIDYTEVRERKNLIVFIAGHGHFDSVIHDDGFIVLKDSKSLRDDRGLRSYFQFVALQKILDNLDFKHVLLILDVCFGGKFGYNARTGYTLTREQKEQLDRLAMTEKYRSSYASVDTQYFLDRQLMCGSRYFIASGIGSVKDGEQAHSPFARNVLEALETRGNKNVQQDDLLTFDELKMHCAKGVNMPVHGHFGSHQGGDFVLIPRAVKETLRRG
ncbi:MAG: caspase family protein [Gemmatimonadota bacterium]